VSCIKGRKRHEWIHPLVPVSPAGQSYFLDYILACPWCRALKPMPELKKSLRDLASDLKKLRLSQ